MLSITSTSLPTEPPAGTAVFDTTGHQWRRIQAVGWLDWSHPKVKLLSWAQVLDAAADHTVEYSHHDAVGGAA